MDFKELIPTTLRESFERQIIHPLRQARAEEEAASQAKIDERIDELRVEIRNLEHREAMAAEKVSEAERELIQAQQKLAGARAEKNTVHWETFAKRGEIERLSKAGAGHGDPRQAKLADAAVIDQRYYTD